MVKNIKIFQCTINENDKIQESILDGLRFNYKEANYDTINMTVLSKIIKEYYNKEYCTLPLCHTVEAEALGSSIIIDNEVGNRITKYAINGRDEFNKITKIDFSSGRISKVLEAVLALKNEEEKVCLNVTGPISLATSIMDSQLSYRSIRKDRDSIITLMEIIEENIVDFILKGVSLGVDIISYADPTGTIDIVGPKFYQDISGKSTYKILKRIENQLGNTIVHICGKTSTSLEAIGLLEVEEIKIESNSYFEMIEVVRSNHEDIKFIGHGCMKLNKVEINRNIKKCMIL